MTDTAPETPAAPAVAGPFLAGTFALFHTPTGGMHLVWREKDGEDQHVEIPAMLANLALKKAEGQLSPADLFKAMRGGK